MSILLPPFRRYRALQTLASAEPELFQFRTIIHPERDIPIDVLRRLSGRAGELHAVPGASVLATLLIEGDPIRVDVPIGAIRGIGASKGETVFNLDRLPETMDLGNTETLGPLSDKEMARLEAAVQEENGYYSADDGYHCRLQVWDHSFILSNTGASRRFSLWRRLNYDRAITVPVIARPFSLNENALHWLHQEYRLLYCQPNAQLRRLFDDAQAEGNPVYYIAPALDRSAAAILAIAPVHRAPSRAMDAIARIHSLAAGLFDLGRYLHERASTYRFREPHYPLERRPKSMR